MSLKVELETWQAAVEAYDSKDFERSINLFSNIPERSSLLFNIGLILATIGEHENAVDSYNAATELDQYLAVSYFQCGVSNFILQRFQYASKDFDAALQYMRGNQHINYQQLGLDFKLFTCEILFNKALCLINLNQEQEGFNLMRSASIAKVTPDHNVIDEALQERAVGFTVFSIPVGVLYRPPASKIKNLASKDYMGKSKLIAASDANDAFTTFTGVTRKKLGLTPSGAVLREGTVSLTRSQTSSGAPSSRLEVAAASSSRPSTSPGSKPSTRLQRSESSTKSLPNPPEEAARRSGDRYNTQPLAVSGNNSRNNVRTQSAGRSDPMPYDPDSERSSLNFPVTPRESPSQSTQNLVIKTVGTQDYFEEYLSPYGDDDAYNRTPLPYDNKKNQNDRNRLDDNNFRRQPAQDANNQPSRKNSSRVAAASRNNSGRLTAVPSMYSVASPVIQRSQSRRTDPRTNNNGYNNDSYSPDVRSVYESSLMEMVQLRIKLKYRDDARGMVVDPDLTFIELLDKIEAKFGRSQTFKLKFKDEDGTFITLLDESDWEHAIEFARSTSRNTAEGRLEIHLADR